MEMKWLEDFLSLVDTRNFTRSAELRFTTQPAFSRRIKSLEEWIGTALIERSTQPVSLTPAGQKLRPVAEEVLRRLYQVREDIRHVDHAAASTITFAATHSLSLTFFPNWIRDVEARKGVLFTRLDTCHVEQCVQSLLKGHCHFVLCHTHPSVEINLPPNDFRSVVVGVDRLLPVSAANPDGTPMHPLPGTRERPAHYLAYAETSAIGRATEKMLARRTEPAHLERVFVSHLAAVLESMTRSGRGMAWLLASQIEDDLASGRLVPAGDDSWSIPVEIRLYRSNDALPPKSEEFWSAVTSPGEGEAKSASR
ncbi:MAG TPA: LysR family transcriptional regulator [Casimicrobiaceae bacterium]|nr:LysR family transcriptional regulator [Casimicrobiaceae bacterium]